LFHPSLGTADATDFLFNDTFSCEWISCEAFHVATQNGFIGWLEQFKIFRMPNFGGQRIAGYLEEFMECIQDAPKYNDGWKCYYDLQRAMTRLESEARMQS